MQIIRAKADPNYKPPYTSVVQCVRTTLASSGFRGPFQGLAATIVRNAPANAIYLGSFEVRGREVGCSGITYRSRRRRARRDSNAGFCQVGLQGHISTRCNQHASAPHSTRTLRRSIPQSHSVFKLTHVQVIKNRVAEQYGCEVKDLSAGVIMGAGGFGGLLYWLALFPVDVIKSAMMTDSVIPAERQYPTMVVAAQVHGY
jgi:hypothetical protein